MDTGDRTWSATSAKSPGCQVVAVSDLRPERLRAVQAPLPGGETTADYERHAERPAGRRGRDRDAGVARTTTLALRGAAAPASTSGREADDARRRTGARAWSTKRSAAVWCSLVDHTFVYTGAVRKIEELVASGDARRHLLLRLRAREPRACSSTTST